MLSLQELCVITPTIIYWKSLNAGANIEYNRGSPYKNSV